jgi:hypothetical protein
MAEDVVSAAMIRGPKLPKNTYWDRRDDSIYLHASRQICAKFAKSPKSVLDVGSHGTPTLEWHRAPGTRLVSLDLKRPYRAEGIEAIRMCHSTW